MRYRLVFKNSYIRIAVHSDSKRICELVENFFDFNKASNGPIPEISISVYLEDLGFNAGTDCSILKIERLEENRTLLSSLDSRIVEVRSDLRSGTIHSKIFWYQDTIKERIMDFALMEPLRMMLGSRGMFFIHGSMVAKGDRSLIISGPQGSGKTTLALLLRDEGFKLLTDDDCYIKIAGDGIRAYPFPTKLGLSDSILKMRPGLAGQAVREYRYGGKRRLAIGAVTEPENAPYYKCDILIFPRYIKNRKISLKRIMPERAVRILTGERLSRYPEKESRKMVWTFYAFTKRADSYELIYNDDHLNKIGHVLGKVF